MATVVNNLGFRMTSSWDPSGMAEARRDIEKFRAELEAISGSVKVDVEIKKISESAAAVEELTRDRRLTVTIELEGLETANAAIEELTHRRLAHIDAEAETDNARAALNELTNRRSARIEAEAETSRARAELEELTHNQRVTIDANVNSSSMSDFLGISGKSYAIIGAIIAGLEALSAVAVVAGAALVAALGAGIVGAGLAVIAMNDKMVKSQKEARQAAQDTADTANNNLVKAYKNVSDAQRTIKDTADEGARSIKTASEESVSANQSLKQSQLDVNQAYKDSQRALEDLQMQQAQSGDDIESARIALARAQERQATLGSKGPVSALDVREAINSTALAQDHLNSTMEKAKRTNEDANLATAKGVAGSDKVVKAKQNEANAEIKAADAKQNVAVAQHKAAENNQKAQEALTTAVQGVTQAQKEATQAQQKLNQVIAEGSDTLHTFMASIAAMAEPLRGPMRDALNSFKIQLHDLAPAITGLFASSAPLIKPFADSISGVVKTLLPGFLTAIQNAGPVVSGFRDGMVSFAGGISKMFVDMAPASQAMGDAWRVTGSQFGTFMGLWGKFVADTGTQGVKVLDGILGSINGLTEGILNMSRFLNAIFAPIGKGISIVIDALKGDKMSSALQRLSAGGDKIIKPLKDLFNDPQFQASLKDFTANIGPKLIDIVSSLAAVAGAMLSVFVKIAPPILDITFKITESVIQVITWLTSGIRMLTNFTTEVANWFLVLTGAGNAWFISWEAMWKSWGNTLLSIWNAVITPFTASWNAFWNLIKGTAKSIWDGMTSAFTDFGSKIVDGFTGIVDKVKSIWDGIRHAVGDPINAVIGFYNSSIGTVTHTHMDPLHFSGGGPVYGAGGPTEDRIPAMLSNKEFVVNAKDAQRNLPLLNHVNSGGVVGYAAGGTVMPDASGSTTGSPAVSRALSFASGLSGQPYNAEGWLDCSGLASALYDKLKGVDPHREFTTVSNFAALGFKPGSGGIMDIGVLPLPGNSGHMAITLGGHKIESGGTHGIQFDGPALGADAGLFTDHYYLPGSQFNPAYAGPGADGAGSGHSLLGKVGGFFSSAADAVTGGVRSVAGGLFKRLTDPVLSGIPDPITGTDKPWGSYPKSFATYGRDQLANLVSGNSANAAANLPIGGVIPSGDHLALIDAALSLTNTPPPGSKAAWEAGMNTLVGRESGWNSAAINMTDSNAVAGHPSKGLAQTIDGTFASYAAPGHNNIWEPVDNLAASINYIKSRYGDIGSVQQANANMPARGYAGGTNSAAPGLALVGEKGPEIINFKGGEEILPLTAASANAAGQNFAKATLSQAASDLHIDTSGSGFLPQLFTQSFSYGQQLASYAAAKPGVGYDPQPGVTPAPGQSGPTDVHFHTSNMDEALKKWRQQVKIQGMGFNI